MMKRSDLRKSVDVLAKSLETLGAQLLENPDDEVIEARYELALRQYCKVAEALRRQERAFQSEIRELIDFADEMHAAG